MSKRKVTFIVGTVVLVAAGGLLAWLRVRGAASSSVPDLLYELRASQPGHMKSPPLFARTSVEIQADLDALGTEAVPTLIAALDDPTIHHLAAEQLGRLRDPEAIPPLVDFLANPRGLNPYFVNEALQQFDPALVAAAISKSGLPPNAANGPPGPTEDPAQPAWNRDVVQKLIATLKQDDPANYRRRFEAIQALSTLGDPRAAEALLTLLDDETAKEQDLQARRRADASLLRPTAAMALGRLKDDRAYEVLGRLVQTDENAGVRAGAIRGLKYLGDPRAIPLLQRVAAGELTPATPQPPDTDIDWFIIKDAAEEALRELQSR